MASPRSVPALIYPIDPTGGEHDLHLPGDEIGHRRPRTTIGHVHHFDAGHHLEQLAGDMCVLPMPADPMLILPGLALA